MQITNTKPCLEQTPQGFSVSYNQRFLYSKYNPQKSILQTIEKLQILPGTAILCCSPALTYGLFELSEKLPENCIMYLCEADQKLLEFEQNQYSNIPENCIRLNTQDLYNLPFIIQNGIFKRVVKIDFSAGVQFHQEFYTNLFSACISSIKTYWVNRITLTKFGRRYSKNFFLNLRKLPFTTPIENFIGKINKPILIFGAGESCNTTLKTFIENKADSSRFYILCVDTILPALLKHNIIPDGVFIEEAQAVIAKAFIGAKNYNIHIFAGLSSLPVLSKLFAPEQISYFTTKFTNAKFLQSLENKDLLPHSNLPMGSVGLTAVYYGLKFRSSTSIPIYVFGLDFSYSTGRTHANGTLAHTQRLISTNRLSPVPNYAAAFGEGTFSTTDKNGNNVITSQVLSGYSELFRGQFANQENLFDGTQFGLNLGLQRCENQWLNGNSCLQNCIGAATYTKTQDLKDYLNNERQALLRLRALLTGEAQMNQEQRSEEIKKLAEPREYLYLHFPDGNQFSMELSFLKRLRTQIEYFLKWID